MRIGVTVPSPIGHLSAMTTLARRLASRGHEVICIGFPDAASGVAAGGLRFEEYCGNQFPLGSYAERATTLSKLSGDAGFAYTLQWIQDGCRAELAETAGVLQRLGLDGLVVDQVQQGVSPVAMATGVPFVHIACTPLIDLTGVTPLWLYSWPHEDGEPAHERSRMGVAQFLKVTGGLAALVVEYLEGNGIRVDTTDLYWRTSKLAYLTQMPAALDFPADHLPAHFHRTGPFHDGAGREAVAF